MRSSLIIMTILLLSSCSGIRSKDCFVDMHNYGLQQGRAGAQKKLTDDLRNKCLSKNPEINLEEYEKGFYQGWTEYCLPNRAFEMGKRADRYVSFCPAERESQFREKYLIGKHHFELKDTEMEINEQINDLRPNINKSAADYDLYTKLQKEMEKIRREIQALEVEGNKNTFNFR